MLNQQQKQAVEHINGPLLLIAGAGTGKTYTLISKIENIVKNKKAYPSQVLAITFTNKAAHELHKRLLKNKIRGVNALTFHSLAARLLREYWIEDFKILSINEQKEIIESLLTKYEQKDIKTILLNMQNEQMSDLKISKDRLKAIKTQYEKILEEKNSLDFSRLITKLISLWKENPEILKKCRDIFKYILVDEFQDVNKLQIEIINLLAESHKNLCVVGDPDQTIYSWRGANATSMLEFEKKYPQTKKIILEKNYRNPPKILKGAEKLITYNSNRFEKKLLAQKTNSEKISLWQSTNEDGKNEIIIHLLESLIGSHSAMHLADQFDSEKDDEFKDFKSIAFIFRTQAEGKRLASLLSRKGYPYQLSNPENFWEKKEIIEFLKEIKIFQFKQDFYTGKACFAKTKFSQHLSTLIQNFIESKNLSKTKANNLNKLISIAINFDDLEIKEAFNQFLDEIKTNQDADNIFKSDSINLLTFHAAKGLEFPIVIILGLEEDTLPHKKLKDEEYWLEEERRLLYVGMTRATESLHLIQNKKENGKTLSPSRFIAEIDISSLEYKNLPAVRQKSFQRKQAKKAQISMF